MSKIAMVLRKAPYGDINAAEAVRHALGGTSEDIKISLIMIDAGVLLARKGQNDTGTGFTNLEGALKDCIDMGVEVYADKVSLRERHVESGEMVDGVKIVNGTEIAKIVKEAKTTMIF
jgi:predicted peroxiredoxin